MADGRSDTTTMRIVPEVRDEMNRRRKSDQTQSGYIRWAMDELDRRESEIQHLRSELDNRRTTETLLDELDNHLSESPEPSDDPDTEQLDTILSKLDNLERQHTNLADDVAERVVREFE